MLNKSRIAITMGDPAGIGAEIIVKALNTKNIYEKCMPIVIGDKSVLQNALKICEVDLEINNIENVTGRMRWIIKYY